MKYPVQKSLHDEYVRSSRFYAFFIPDTIPAGMSLGLSVRTSVRHHSPTPTLFLTHS